MKVFWSDFFLNASNQVNYNATFQGDYNGVYLLRYRDLAGRKKTVQGNMVLHMREICVRRADNGLGFIIRLQIYKCMNSIAFKRTP